MQHGAPAGPLSGVRVLESTTMITGPLAGQMLGDLGAEIIKVEHPKSGDPFRRFRGGSASPYFCAYNRNKKSIALDVSSSQGREIYLQLIKRSDVLIENFRPGVMDRLGLPLATLRAANPQLIVCSISGFGASGPYRDRPAYDAVAQALSGITSLFLGDDVQITGPTIADNLTGIFACYGILGALYERACTGTVRHVQTNMLDSAIALMPDQFATSTLLGVEPGPLTRVQASQSFSLVCGDQKLLAVHMSSQDKFWIATCEALECKSLLDDPRFVSRASRMENYLQLAIKFREAVSGKKRSYWIQRLEKSDVPHAPINTLSEAMSDPQVEHLQTFVGVDHPTAGPYKTVRRPVYYDGGRDDQPLLPPPELNEHGEAIMRDLGCGDETITRWREHNAALQTAK